MTCLSYATKCLDSLHLIYNMTTKACDCEPGYFYNSDKTFCIAIASTCLAENHIVYNAQSLACECQNGFKKTSAPGTPLVCQSICLVDEQYNLQTEKCVKLCP